MKKLEKDIFENNKIGIKKIEVDVAKVGHITNCYVIYDKITKNGILLDPGYDETKIISIIEESKINIKKIVLTHTHYDHIHALKKVRDYFNTDVYVHKEDVYGIYDEEKNYSIKLNLKILPIEEKYIKKLEENDIIIEDEIELLVIHTPGHTSGGIILYEKNLNVMFTGDTIFSNCHGRVDLKSGSMIDMKNSLKKVLEKYENKEIDILPGHGPVEKLDIAKKKIKLLMAVKGE